MVWVVERERQRVEERSCRGLERRERESRDILFLLGYLLYILKRFKKLVIIFLGQKYP